MADFKGRYLGPNQVPNLSPHSRLQFKLLFIATLELFHGEANQSCVFPDPTPAEEAAARAKETPEQAALPYKWQQTIAELNVTFTVPGNIKSKDLVIDIKKQSLSAGIKGQDPVIKVGKNAGPYMFQPWNKNEEKEEKEEEEKETPSLASHYHQDRIHFRDPYITDRHNRASCLMPFMSMTPRGRSLPTATAQRRLRCISTKSTRWSGGPMSSLRHP